MIQKAVLMGQGLYRATAFFTEGDRAQRVAEAVVKVLAQNTMAVGIHVIVVPAGDDSFGITVEGLPDMHNQIAWAAGYLRAWWDFRGWESIS